jgi:hypothetical protein
MKRLSHAVLQAFDCCGEIHLNIRSSVPGVKWRSESFPASSGFGLKLNATSGVSPALQRSFNMSKRELIDTGTDKRYVRRDEHGRFSESDDLGKSLSQDVRRSAKTKVKSGQGDRGDR